MSVYMYANFFKGLEIYDEWLVGIPACDNVNTKMYLTELCMSYTGRKTKIAWTHTCVRYTKGPN